MKVGEEASKQGRGINDTAKCIFCCNKDGAPLLEDEVAQVSCLPCNYFPSDHLPFCGTCLRLHVFICALSFAL